MFTRWRFPRPKLTSLYQVLQFLQHDGYVETARAFAGEIQSEKQSLCLDPGVQIPGIDIRDDEDANNRQRECYFVPGKAIRRVANSHRNPTSNLGG